MDVNLSVVYGSNSASVRKELWRELMRISQVVQGPWLVAGDFNTVKEVYKNMVGETSMFLSLNHSMIVYNSVIYLT